MISQVDLEVAEEASPAVKDSSTGTNASPAAAEESAARAEADAAPGAPALPPAAPLPPPPMPAASGGPTPIPAGFAKLQEVKPGTKLRTLHWTKIPNSRLEESLWKNADDLILSINGSRLKEFYKVGNKQSTKSKSVGKGGELIMDNDKARVVGIFLSSGKIEGADIGAKLYETEKNVRLSMDQLVALKRIQPSDLERKKYESFSGKPNSLHDVDRFMLELCKVKDLSKLIDIQLLLQEFPSQLVSFPPLIENFNSACSEIFLPGFKRVLEYLRAIGNYLNSGNAKGDCYGFSISSLNQITTVRGTDKSYGLLNYLVDTIVPHEKLIGRLPTSMGYVREMAGVSVMQLSNEVDQLETALDRIINHVKDIMALKPNDMQLVFSTRVLKHAQAFRVEVTYVKKAKDDMVKKYNKACTYLGESPSSEDFFTHIAQFLVELEHTMDKSAKDAASQKLESKVQKLSEEKMAGGATVTPSGPMAHLAKQPGMILAATASQTASIAKSTKPTKQGWLEKSTGGPLNRFDKRWFEVDDTGNLYYYKKEGSRALGSLYLRGSGPTLDDSHPGMIVFAGQSRKFQLLAKSREEALEWLEVMSVYA